MAVAARPSPFCVARAVAGLAIAGLGATAQVTAEAAGPDVLQLNYGDPARRERQVTVAPGDRVDTRTGDRLELPALARRLDGVQLVFMGEDHTSADSHAAQAALVRALDEAGRDVVIALEMFPWTTQAVLDRWTAGGFETDADFLDASGWYENWGYRWEYYRDILHYARDHRLPLVAVNAPRDLVKQVRLTGLEALADAGPEAAPHLPPRVDTDSAEYRRLFETYMGVAGTSHAGAALDGLFRAQCTWDAVMGWNALRALEARPGRATIVVVLLGAGHVTYGLGAPRQVAAALPAGRLATLVPVAVAREGQRVQASYADIVWGLPPAGATAYPELGVSLAGAPAPSPTAIIQVTPRSPADRAGLRTGDRIVRIGDHAVAGVADLRRGMAGTQWGDRLTLAVRRGEAPADAPPVEVTIVFDKPAGP